jgi:hypothetical protein
MARPTKDELDAIEAQEDEIAAELNELDDMYVQYGHIPGYSQFGFPYDEDYAAYLGPVIAPSTEADISSSPEDWREFLRKIEEDLSK